MEQDELRRLVRIAKAENPEWKYKEMAEAIEITEQSFYNFMSGAYKLSSSKRKELETLLYDLIE